MLISGKALVNTLHKYVISFMLLLMLVKRVLVIKYIQRLLMIKQQNLLNKNLLLHLQNYHYNVHKQ